MSDSTTLFDVLATDIETGAQRYLARDKTAASAEAIVKMAIARRGVEREIYATVPAGHSIELEFVEK